MFACRSVLICLPVYLNVCNFVNVCLLAFLSLSIGLFVCPSSIYTYVCLPFCLTICCLLVCKPVGLCQCNCLPVCLSHYVLFCMHVCLFLLLLISLKLIKCTCQMLKSIYKKMNQRRPYPSMWFSLHAHLHACRHDFLPVCFSLVCQSIYVCLSVCYNVRQSHRMIDMLTDTEHTQREVGKQTDQ